MAGIRYDRSIGANVYDPSAGGNEADQGNAMDALARALGFTNEASGLGLAATFGGPQMAQQALQNLVQSEQQAKQLQNQRELMAMQQSGQAAIAQAKMQEAREQAAATRDMTKWSKQGDWNRYDKQIQATKEAVGSKAAQQTLQKLLGVKSAEDIANARNETTLKAAEMNNQGRQTTATQTRVSQLTSKLAQLQAQPIPKNPNEMAEAAFKLREMQQAGDKTADMNKALGYVRIENAKNHQQRLQQAAAPLLAELQALQGGPAGGIEPGVAQGQGEPDNTPIYDIGANTTEDMAPPSPISRGASQFQSNFPNAGSYMSAAAGALDPAKRVSMLLSNLFGPVMFPNELGQR